MGVFCGVVSCFLLVWGDMVGAGGLKCADPAMELEQVARQQQKFLVSQCAYLLSLQLLLTEVHKPLFTK
jgi:hypothetical protein